MLSGLLITLNVLVCIALIGVVLLQRSEGGAFGMGGGPTGLITARGAGDLLTRTTWVLFSLFLVLSLGLTLLGAHDRATSAVIEKLKLQQANPNALNQAPAAPAAPVNATLPATSPFLAPPPVSAAPATAAAPVPVAPTPAKPAPGAHAVTPKPAPAHAAQAPAQAAPPPPVLEAPPPTAAPPAAATPAKPSSDSPAPAPAP